MAIYIPRVLICGDVGEFNKKIGNKPVEIVGQIKFDKIGDDVNLFFGKQNLSEENITPLLDGAAEYLIFVDTLDFYYYLKKFPHNAQVMSVEAFAKKNFDGFFSEKMFFIFNGLLEHKKIFKRILDFDCLCTKSDYRTSRNLNFEIDCVAGKIFPIMENVYGKIYRSFDECKFHHFDGIILTKERTPAEFIDTLIETDSLAENIFTFVRKNSELEIWLAANENIFAQIERYPTENGAWCILKKIISPADVGVYVVTHKDVQLKNLPDGYKIIHAGHALAKKDFGYLGDDTGDNISRLNPFLDEVTALYWIWKNTKHTHTGFVHYRRFLTGDENQKDFDAEKILSATEIVKILNDCDIIVINELMTERNQLELMLLSTGQPDLVRISEKIVREHLAKAQPDYLDAYDEIINGFTLFLCGIHLTRRNIFNAYCEWLFSFMIDATEEMRDTVMVGGTKIGDTPHYYSRMMSFFAERMLTVWLTKNHLRIKTLPIMFRENV